MENKFGGNFGGRSAEQEGYLSFALWELIVIGAGLALIVVNCFISSTSVMIWIVNFLLQLALFTVVGAIFASLLSGIFKKWWAAFFAIIFILGSLFGLYDAIRGYNFRKDQEAAYKEQIERAQQQQQAQQQQEQQAAQNQQPIDTKASPVK